MHAVLTGAGGYIGRRLLAVLLNEGWLVSALGRVPSAFRESECVVSIPWRLGEPIPTEHFDGPRGRVDAVIHMAHDWNSRQGTGEVNLRGTELLLEWARRADVRRFVFVSSMSARADAPTRYGRIKYSIEQKLRAPGEVAARLGLVYGGRPAGLYDTMLRLSRLPILPMIDAGQLVQPILLDEACDGLKMLAQPDAPGRPVYRLGASEPVAFGEFLRTLATVVHGSRLRLIPVPRRLAVLAADLSAAIPVVPTVDRERVLGLAAIQVQDSRNDLLELGLSSPSIAAGLATRRVRTRRLLVEGKALLHYCLGARPRPSTIRRYVQSLQKIGETEPMDLPASASRWPATIRFHDDPRQGGSALRRRLGIAARIAEASGEPPDLLHAIRDESRLLVILRLLCLALMETIARGIGWLFRKRRQS